jgi:NTE family protein
MVDFATIFSQPAHQGDHTHTQGAGLCLSGGGYRAMLFHVGALRRLHEIGALAQLARITSVSGGSITAGVVARHWADLTNAPGEVAAFEQLVQTPLFDFAATRLDIPAVLKGLLTPRRRISDYVAAAYRPLFDNYSLQDLPSSPRFVFLASNLGSGAVVRFAQPYTADAKVGKRDGLDLPLTRVVAASSAFPPFLGPAVFKLTDQQALTETFPDPAGDELALHTHPYTHRLELGDGGIYDNLGLQPLEQFHTILASDGGSPFKTMEHAPTNWLSNMKRSWLVTDNQVRSLRKHDLVDDYQRHRRNGTYWGIRSDVTDYPRATIPASQTRIDLIAGTPTRLWPLPEQRRKELINWGYAICDTALRSHVESALDSPALPYPDAPLA